MQSISNLTVSAASYVCAAVSGLVALGLPLALAAVCRRRQRGALRAVGVGALCFFVGAVVLESLCHQLILGLFPIRARPVFYLLYGCLAAGLFEETARLVGLRWLCRRDAAPMTGFAYGVGHGGIESILIAGLGAVSNLVTMTAINAGQAGEILASLPEGQRAAAEAQLVQLAALPAATFLASGVERIAAIAFHIALSMVIWMVVTGRIPRWGYAVAVALHAGLDSIAMLYQMGVLQSIWLTEALVMAASAAVCLGVRKVYRATQTSPA